MEMADSLDQLLGNRDSTGTATSMCTSRPVSAAGGAADMNGPRLDSDPDPIKRSLTDEHILRRRRDHNHHACDTDSCGEVDGLMDDDADSLSCGPNSSRGTPGAVTSLTDLIRINVGGSVFVTQRSTLARIPDTRLSALSENDPNYNAVTGEWFFDRNPQLFNFLLDFYRTDELHFPHTYCGPSIKKELLFWQIDECEISPCCWNRYQEFDHEKKIFDQIERAFESRTLAQYEASAEMDVVASKWQKIKKKVYIFMEEPMSSKAAKIWTGSFLLMVLVSIGILCIETHPSVRVDNPPKKLDLTKTNLSTVPVPSVSPTPGVSLLDCPEAVNETENWKIQLIMDTSPHPALEYIDSVLTLFFTAEFFVRLIVCPNKVQFWKSVMNIIDVLCVLPMWIKNVMKIYDFKMEGSFMALFFVIMILRVLRICRVLRLARHYTGVKILLLALKASFRELFMLLVFVFIVILIFAVVIYYAEFFEKDTFYTIPDGYWWAIITLTTVGYGDMYPKSGLGYLVGACCALTGILATGLPVPIIANNFNLYYSHAALKEAVANRKPGKHRKPQLALETCSLMERDGLVMKEAAV